MSSIAKRFPFRKFLIRWMSGCVPIWILAGIIMYDLGFERMDSIEVFSFIVFWYLLFPGFLIASLTTWYTFFESKIQKMIIPVTILLAWVAGILILRYGFTTCEEMGCLAVFLYVMPFIALIVLPVSVFALWDFSRIRS